MKRRQILKTLALGGVAAVLSGAMRLPATDETSAAEASNTRKPATRFAHMTDVHVHPGRSSAQGLAQAIRHVHALENPPEFILNGGDAINDALAVDRAAVEVQWGLWKSAWKENGSLPLRHCVGNHDVWGWDKAKSKTTGDEAGWGKQLALDQLELKKSHHAFDQGGWRFIVLDSMTYDEETAYRAEIDAAQFEWLRTQLQKTPVETPIVLVSHIPILTVGTLGFVPRLRKYPPGHKMLSHQDAYELVALLRMHPNVKLCLSGHTHQTETIQFGELAFVNSGAVSGYWWKGDFLHTDEGYNVVDLFDDGTYEVEYVSYGWAPA